MNPLNADISYLQTALETAMTFLVLLILTRVLGKKQLGHLTFFNYITGITIGSIAANMVMQEGGIYERDYKLDNMVRPYSSNRLCWPKIK